MALPTLIKTYSIRANTKVTAQGSIYKSKMMSFKAIKDNLVLDGWTVVSSSSGRVDTGAVAAGTQSNSDNWNSLTDFAGTDTLGVPSGARYPWIVLQNSALGAGTFQLLMSTTGSIQTANMLIQVSPSVGFSGGAIGTNPTAADSITLINNATSFSGTDATHKIHTWVSTDKEVTKVVVWRGGDNLCLYLDICKPQDVVSGWTNPSVSTAQAATSGIAITYANLCTHTNRARTAGTIALSWTGEFDRSTTLLLAEEPTMGAVQNDLTNEWPFYGIGMCSKTVGSKGRHGAFYDTWWKCIGIPQGTTFADSCTTRSFVACGPLLLPWKGDSTQMDMV